MDTSAKTFLEHIIRENSISVINDMKNSGVGVFTGALLEISKDKTKDELFKSLTPHIYEIHSSPWELRGFISDVVDRVYAEYA